jgi:hypothetical protein
VSGLLFAHVAGVPIEEGALAVAPVASVFAVLVGARLSELAGWLRRRKLDDGTQ